MENFIGDARVFLMWNTTMYNDDNVYAVHRGSISDMESLGWERYEKCYILNTRQETTMDELEVGVVLESADYKGVYLTRLA